MKIFVIFLSLFVFMACTPPDRPIKGRDGKGKEKNKIALSAYNGNVNHASLYAINRLDEVKRLVELALNPDAITDDDVEFDLNEIKCGNAKPSYVLADKISFNEGEKVFRFTNNQCKVYDDNLVSVRQSGEEFFEAKFSAADGSLQVLNYDAINLNLDFGVLTQLEKTKGFSKTSSGNFKEDRELKLRRRVPQRIEVAGQVQYFFRYESRGNFEQLIREDRLQAREEAGEHRLLIQGDLYISEGKVVSMAFINMDLDHVSPRQVDLRRGKGGFELLFTNEKNGFDLRISSQGQVEFKNKTKKNCRDIDGEFLVENYFNTNDKRNRFFGPLDEVSSAEVAFKGGLKYSALREKDCLSKLRTVSDDQKRACTGNKRQVKSCHKKVAEEFEISAAQCNLVEAKSQSCASRKPHMQSQPYGLIFIR